jgi:hypothetical protein
MHPGHAVVKTSLRPVNALTLTSTIAVSTGVSTAGSFRVKTKLAATYYTFLHSGTFCTPPAERVVLPVTRTTYARLSKSTETYSEGCGTPTTFYGDVYDLTTRRAKGSTDSFVSNLIGKGVHFNGNTYRKATLHLDVAVAIGS